MENRKGARKISARRPFRGLCATLLPIAILSATPALAQDAAPSSSAEGVAAVTETAGIRLNLPSGPALDSFDTLDFNAPILDLPVDAVGSTLFKLDLSDQSCLSGTAPCRTRNDGATLGLSRYITARQGSGIDLVLRPRASLRFDNDGSSALVGAVVEIGEDLRREGDYATNTWYLFAGADAEALTFAPDSVRNLSSGRFGLQDRIIVGDAQAGVGYRIGDADVSLSYLRREANAEGISYNEDAAALSFTWKR